MSIKFNPFQPNGIVGPGMFVGRAEELRTIEQSLLQTRHGNPHHFLVQGERGIGKSSLLIYVEALAKGRITFGKLRYNFLVVSTDLGGCSTQIDIIRQIGRGLQDSLKEFQEHIEVAVDNALGSLKAKNIIIQDSTRRGFYKLPTNSFAAWINALQSARAKGDVARDAGVQ